jgi:hypothetical protein
MHDNRDNTVWGSRSVHLGRTIEMAAKMTSLLADRKPLEVHLSEGTRLAGPFEMWAVHQARL